MLCSLLLVMTPAVGASSEAVPEKPAKQVVGVAAPRVEEPEPEAEGELEPVEGEAVPDGEAAPGEGAEARDEGDKPEEKGKE